MRESLEQKTLIIATNRLQPLALNPLFVSVMRVEMPVMLESRFEESRKRAEAVQHINIFDLVNTLVLSDENQFIPHHSGQVVLRLIWDHCLQRDSR